MCIGSRRQVETVSRSLECSASVEGGLERFESGDLLRKEKTSVPFRDHDPSGTGVFLAQELTFSVAKSEIVRSAYWKYANSRDSFEVTGV